MTSDKQLLTDFGKGDQQAFAELVRRYQRLVFSICLGVTRNRTLAEDASQETFLALAKQAHAIRGEVAAWLYTVARRLALRWRHKHQQLADADALELPEDLPAAELVDAVDAALQELDERLRSVLMLRFVDDLKQQDIAEQLNLHQTTVGRLLKQGTTELQRLLKQHGFGLAGAAVLGALAAKVPGSLHQRLGLLSLGASGGKTLSVSALIAWTSSSCLVLAGLAFWVFHQPTHPANPSTIQEPSPLVISADETPAPAPAATLGTQAKKQLQQTIWARYQNAYPVEVSLSLLQRSGVHLLLAPGLAYACTIDLPAGKNVADIVDHLTTSLDGQQHRLSAADEQLVVQIQQQDSDHYLNQIETWSTSPQFQDRRRACLAILKGRDPRCLASLPRLLHDKELAIVLDAVTAGMEWASWWPHQDKDLRQAMLTGLDAVDKGFTKALVAAKSLRAFCDADWAKLHVGSKPANWQLAHALRAHASPAANTTLHAWMRQPNNAQGLELRYAHPLLDSWWLKHIDQTKADATAELRRMRSLLSASEDLVVELLSRRNRWQDTQVQGEYLVHLAVHHGYNPQIQKLVEQLLTDKNDHAHRIAVHVMMKSPAMANMLPIYLHLDKLPWDAQVKGVIGKQIKISEQSSFPWEQAHIENWTLGKARSRGKRQALPYALRQALQQSNAKAIAACQASITPYWPQVMYSSSGTLTVQSSDVDGRSQWPARPDLTRLVYQLLWGDTAARGVIALELFPDEMTNLSLGMLRRRLDPAIIDAIRFIKPELKKPVLRGRFAMVASLGSAADLGTELVVADRFWQVMNAICSEDPAAASSMAKQGIHRLPPGEVNFLSWTSSYTRQPAWQQVYQQALKHSKAGWLKGLLRTRIKQAHWHQIGWRASMKTGRQPPAVPEEADGF